MKPQSREYRACVAAIAASANPHWSDEADRERLLRWLKKYRPQHNYRMLEVMPLSMLRLAARAEE